MRKSPHTSQGWHDRTVEREYEMKLRGDDYLRYVEMKRRRDRGNPKCCCSQEPVGSGSWCRECGEVTPKYVKLVTPKRNTFGNMVYRRGVCPNGARHRWGLCPDCGNTGYLPDEERGVK